MVKTLNFFSNRLEWAKLKIYKTILKYLTSNHSLANSKSAEKRIGINKQNSLRNRFYKSSVRIFIKKKIKFSL